MRNLILIFLVFLIGMITGNCQTTGNINAQEEQMIICLFENVINEAILISKSKVEISAPKSNSIEIFKNNNPVFIVGYIDDG